MAITAIPTIPYPNITEYLAASVAYNGVTLDASGEYAAAIIPAPQAGTIEKIHFRVGGVTGAGNVDVRIESLDDSTGLPSGMLWATDTNAVVPISAANSFYSATLTAGAVVTRSSKIAVVLRWVSGSYSVSRLRWYHGTGFPYRVENTGTPTKLYNAEQVVAGLEYSDGTMAHAPGVAQFGGGSSNYVNSGTSPDEIGNVFTLPISMSMCGFAVMVGTLAAFDVVLYQGATALLTVAVDTDINALANNATFEILTEEITLAKDTEYLLVIKPGASNVSTFILSGHAAIARSAMPGGSAWQRTQRTDDGAWTDVDTDQVMIGLLVNGIDAGGGGMSRSRVVNQ